ncbi:MoxR-like ATPase [Halomicrobium zhouii]|uniref:MoxR-like ATPase n=1 Tax=Halomicrobium zhouii TaxID=767519 RepID=A0A1I6LY92_9EURY|nr:MoxR family ATPase [Halomicrobium zhouii]SFS08400.1 MoxR-like ATPase [Halomicrobium zhouii]
MTDELQGRTVEAAADTCLDVVERVEEAAVVERGVLLAILAAVVSKGHVLLEDVPGTGKTVTARVFAEALGLEFKRIQFTPDLLPADVTGSNVYDEHTKEFEFSKGPIFANVVLADEINRAPPKTQAALLEAMEEGQVSVDGTTYDLPEPFVVIATQNPIEQEGTFRLPEAQRDRFSVKTSFGYPDVDGEMALLDRRAGRRTLSPSVEPVVDRERVVELQDLAEDVRVDEKVRRYIVDVARATRTDDRVDVGVSPRGVQRVFEAARAAALVAGRRYVTPDDVKRLAETTMAHRLVLTTEATVEGVQPGDVIRDALDSLDVPAVSPDASESADGSEPTDADGSAGDADAAEPATDQPDSDGTTETDGSPGEGDAFADSPSQVD